MEKNKTKKPYEKPSMTVYEVEPMMILAGSPGDPVDAQGINGGTWSYDEAEITSTEQK